jgi:Ulp1 family protease
VHWCTEGGNIFQLDKLLIPLNIKKHHWLLAVVFMKERRVQIFDSSPYCSTGNYSHRAYLTIIKNYLNDEHMVKYEGKQLPKKGPKGWCFHSCPSGNTIVPQQGGTNDCGVFVCYFMDLVMDHCPISDLTQEAIEEHGRDWIGATILNKDIEFKY